MIAIRHRQQGRNTIFCNAPSVPTTWSRQFRLIGRRYQSRSRIPEGLIGSIRRPRTDHLIVFNALKRPIEQFEDTFAYLDPRRARSRTYL